ncbi:MAG: undecaprenyl-diphosphatase UppP [Anaerolineales bacterium]
MSVLEAIILGIVQGAAEFLPISSSGHLVLVPWWLGWDAPPLVFDVAVHVGTTAAIIAHFWRDWLRLVGAGLNAVRKRAITEPDARVFFFLILGTIPAGVAGLLLDDYFETTFSEPALVACMLFVTAGLLLYSERHTGTPHTMQEMTWRDALFIGVAQALAIMPGISRSGSTIAAGLLRDLNRDQAARYSFLLATPIILAAGTLQAVDVVTGEASLAGGLGTAVAVGFVTSAVVGYACIALLLRFIRQQRLTVFALYCIAFGAVSLIAALAG